MRSALSFPCKRTLFLFADVDANTQKTAAAHSIAPCETEVKADDNAEKLAVEEGGHKEGGEGEQGEEGGGKDVNGSGQE